LAVGGPVIVEDIEREQRFPLPALLHEHGVHSGISVVIPGSDGRPWGVLGTHTRRVAKYSVDDANFVQAAAHLLAAALARHAAEQGLRETTQRLQELDHRRTEFMNIMAHELRTPLAPMMMRVELMRDGHIAVDDSVNLEVIERNMARMAGLVDQLLELTRLELGTAPPYRPEAVDLSVLVRQAVEMWRITAQRKGVEISSSISDGLLAMVEPSRVHQVIMNLLSNALKFTPAGGRVVVSCQRTDEAFAIVIEDTGIGFSPEQARLLFQRFSQAHGNERGGYGIGLYVSRAITDRHGGRLTAHSPGPGRGATFGLWLPRVGPPAS